MSKEPRAPADAPGVEAAATFAEPAASRSEPLGKPLAALDGAFDAARAHVLARRDVRMGVCLASGKILRLEARGREWLVSPRPSEDARFLSGEAARDERFDIRHAWGADECLPTVGVFPGVRDHGELWGRQALVSAHAPTRHECRWEIDGQVVTRRIELEAVGTDGVRILVESDFPERWRAEVPPPEGRFEPADHASGRGGSGVRWGAGAPGRGEPGALVLETLYAFHALFLAEEGTRLILRQSGHDAFAASFPPRSRPEARKFFSRADEGRLEHPDGTRVVVRLLEGLAWFGVWWCNDAWGDGRIHRTVGLEPTTHPGDGPLFCQGTPGGGEGGGAGGGARRRVAFSLEFPA